MLLKEIDMDSIVRDTDRDIEADKAASSPVGLSKGRAMKMRDISVTNTEHKSKASEATHELVNLIQQKVRAMYTAGWLDVVYREKYVTVTVSHPANKDVFNSKMPIRNAQLLDKYGVKHRVMGDYRSVIYYVPYQD